MGPGLKTIDTKVVVPQMLNATLKIFEKVWLEVDVKARLVSDQAGL